MRQHACSLHKAKPVGVLELKKWTHGSDPSPEVIPIENCLQMKKLVFPNIVSLGIQTALKERCHAQQHRWPTQNQLSGSSRDPWLQNLMFCLGISFVIIHFPPYWSFLFILLLPVSFFTEFLCVLMYVSVCLFLVPFLWFSPSSLLASAYSDCF